MHFNPARPRAVLKIYIKLFTFSALVKSIINAEKTDKQTKKKTSSPSRTGCNLHRAANIRFAWWARQPDNILPWNDCILSSHLIMVIRSAIAPRQWHKVWGCRARKRAQLSASASCSNACYLPVTRLFQLPPACPISSVWRLLALQNNIRHAGQEGEGGRGRGRSVG